MRHRQRIQGKMAASAALVCAATAAAGTFEWTSPASGLFQDPSRWTLTSGSGGGLPALGDTAVFNEAGSYTVSLASGITTITDTVRALAGQVVLRRSTTSPATLQLTTGGADLTVQHADLRIGSLNLPLNVIVGDSTILYDNGLLYVGYGSSLMTNSLALGNAAFTTGNNRMYVGEGGASTLNVTGQTLIGRDGTNGELAIHTDSQATLGGSCFIGGSASSANSDGLLSITGGADLVANGSLTIGGGHLTSSGTVRVEGLCTVVQNGATNITVGSTSTQGPGLINIEFGGYFQTGTGLTRVRESGSIITGQSGTYGQLSVKGTLDIDGGSFIAHLSNGLALPIGATVPLHNAGHLLFIEPYTIDNNRTINASEDSDFEMLGGGVIGDASNGTITVDGSFFETAGALHIGKSGGFGTLSFAHHATGDLGPVTYLGGLPFNGASGVMTVESGSQVTSDVMNVWGRGTNSMSVLTVSGFETEMTIQASQLAVGHPDAFGDSMIHILDDALLMTTQGASQAGVVRVWPRGLLFIDNNGTMNADSEIIVDGGELRVDGELKVMSNAWLELQQGVISGNGTIRLGTAANHVVVSHGTISPGASAGSLRFESGQIEMNADSVCKIELGGLTPGSQHDQLNMSHGEIYLNGTLDVSLLPGYAPQPGDEFVIVTAEDGVFDVFANVVAPTPMDVVYDTNEVRLVVLPSCTGDVVQSATFAPPPDGVVDGADLAYLLGAWGRNPGSAADIVTSATFAPPPDGVVDGADLAVLLGAWGVCH